MREYILLDSGWSMINLRAENKKRLNPPYNIQHHAES